MSNPMGLTIPTPGVTAGPEYATEVSDDLTIIASHRHTGASNNDGDQVPTAGLDINEDLSMQSNNLNTTRSVRFASQSSTLAGVGDLNCPYVVNGNLYFNNGSGVPIQITSGSAINFNNVVNYATLAVSSNHTINASDNVTMLECDTASTAITITLPATANVPTGRFYIVKDETGHSITHNITINPAGINTIDGAASYTIADNHAAVGVVSDGAGNWAVIAWNRKVYFTGETVTYNSGSTLALAGTLTSTGALNVNGTFVSTVNLSFSSATSSPKIFQSDLTTNSGTGATLTVQAQNETGTTSIGGALSLKSGTGTSTDGAVNVSTGGTTNTSFTTNNVTLSVDNLNFGIAQTPVITQLARTTDVAVHDFTITPQAPFASSTGTNRNAPKFIVNLPGPANIAAARGVFKIVDATVDLLSISGDSSINTILNTSGGGGQAMIFQCAGTQKLQLSPTGIGFYATAAVAKQAVTGSLSTVADAPAKAVLTSILSALSTVGLITNSTT